MKYTPLVITDPGTFAYTEGQTYYQELLAQAILTHAAAMSNEGYEALKAKKLAELNAASNKTMGEILKEGVSTKNGLYYQ